MTLPPRITRAHIATLLGITPERFRKLVEKRPDFPKPALRLSRKTVLWDPSDIQRWLATQKARA
jgi:predicted DNA-binding transcriptional regulator AlpA